MTPPRYGDGGGLWADRINGDVTLTHHLMPVCVCVCIHCVCVLVCLCLCVRPCACVCPCVCVHPGCSTSDHWCSVGGDHHGFGQARWRGSQILAIFLQSKISAGGLVHPLCSHHHRWGDPCHRGIHWWRTGIHRAAAVDSGAEGYPLRPDPVPARPSGTGCRVWPALIRQHQHMQQWSLG